MIYIILPAYNEEKNLSELFLNIKISRIILSVKYYWLMATPPIELKRLQKK